MIGKIQRITKDNFDLFHSEYYLKEIPVIVEKMTDGWEAKEKWTPEFFKEHYYNSIVPVAYYHIERPEYSKREREYKKLGDVIQEIESYQNIYDSKRDSETIKKHGYVVGWDIESKNPELLKQVNMDEPHFLNNWIDRLPKSVRLPHTDVFIGSSYSSTPLHTDSFFVNPFLTVLYGIKKVRIISHKFSHLVKNGMDVFDDKIAESITQNGGELFECELRSGDMISFPPGWWHTVKNIGITIGFQNLHVDNYRFPVFEKEIRKMYEPTLNRLKELTNEARSEIKKSSPKNFSSYTASGLL